MTTETSGDDATRSRFALRPLLVFLVNGPPRAGKDTLGQYLAEELRRRGVRTGIYKFAEALKLMAHRMYGTDLPADAYEDSKDRPLPGLFGRTPREVYIALSEWYAKPLHGEGFWGSVLADRVAADLDRDLDGAGNPLGAVVVTDSGFRVEAEVLLAALRKHAGPRGVLPLVVRVSRPGSAFLGDSRGPVDLEGVLSIDVENDGSPDDLEAYGVGAVLRALGEEMSA